MKTKLIAGLVSIVLITAGTTACKTRINDRGRFGINNSPTATATKSSSTNVPQSATSFVDYQGCRSNTDTGGVFNPPCVLDLKDGTYLLEFEDGHGVYYKLCASKKSRNCVRHAGSRYVVVS